MKYYLKSRNTFISILSNLANIGKNLKVFKEVSGRVKQVDK